MVVSYPQRQGGHIVKSRSPKDKFANRQVKMREFAMSMNRIVTCCAVALMFLFSGAIAMAATLWVEQEDVLLATAIDASMLPPGVVFTHIAAGMQGGWTTPGTTFQHSLLVGFIPEPASAILLLAGASLLGMRPRRRHASH